MRSVTVHYRGFEIEIDVLDTTFFINNEWYFGDYELAKFFVDQLLIEEEDSIFRI